MYLTPFLLNRIPCPPFALVVLLFCLVASPIFVTAESLQELPKVDPQSPVSHLDYISADVVFEDEGESIIIRAPQDTVLAPGIAPVGLSNNIPNNLNVLPGETNYYQVSVQQGSRRAAFHEDVLSEHDTVSFPGRQKRATDGLTVYISINTCLQPKFLSSADNESPPQLELYISESNNVTLPGPSNVQGVYSMPLVEGYAGLMLSNVTENVYIGVSAPTAKVNGTSAWNYEIAASYDRAYHSYNLSTPGPTLSLIDSDLSAALLSTTNLTALITSNLTNAPANSSIQQWLSSGPPLSIFVEPTNSSSLNGLRHSYCGLIHAASIIATKTATNDIGIQLGITTSQPGPAPEQQFYVPGLINATMYDGILAQTGNITSTGPGVPGGGGMVFGSMNFTTKRDPNCAVVYNLSFCDSVAYAAPANPFRYNLSSLMSLYDTQAQSLYQNFSYSLQQIPCNTTDTSKYSLAKNCDDCAAAYKTWLCAVTIPRCADFTGSATLLTALPGEIRDGDAISMNSNPHNYLMPRNLAQVPLPGVDLPQQILSNATLLSFVGTSSSRNNDTIAGLIQPGPYKEVLPCEDLCYELVRSCPAALGFGCPTAGKGLESSYGKMGHAADGSSTCSAPGVKWGVNAGPRLPVGTGPVVGVVILVGLFAVLV